jgi:protein-disulfide isomerase
MNFTQGVMFRLLPATVLVFGPLGLADADDGLPVAKIGDHTIFERELDARTSGKLNTQSDEYEQRARELNLAYERSRQAYVEQELNALIDERVLALEAAARKSTPAALTASVESAEITDAQMRSFYDSKKSQVNQSYESLAPQIREFLKKQADDEARRRFLDGLRVKYKVATLLEPLREDVAATGPVRGPMGAPVTIVEFSDFQCPFCGKYAPTLHDVLAKYPSQVRLVYRHLPLTSLHPNAERAAEASICAQDQGKFWEMYDALFAEQSSLGVDALKEKAKRLGLDSAKFDHCLDSGESKDVVQLDVRAADQLGISSTPASFVNGRFVRGAVSVEELSHIIDDELRRAALTARR